MIIKQSNYTMITDFCYTALLQKKEKRKVLCFRLSRISSLFTGRTGEVY